MPARARQGSSSQFTSDRDLRHNRRVRAQSLAAPLAVVALASSVLGSGLPEPGIWIPSSASFVAFADLGTLLSSPATEGLETLLAERISPSQLDTFRELTGMDPWRDFHALAFFTGRGPEAVGGERRRDLWGIAIAGGFDPERLVDSLEQRVGVEHIEYREIPLYVFVPGLIPGAAQGDLEPSTLAFPDGSTVLLGSADSVRLMLDAGLGFEAASSGGSLPNLDELSGCGAFCVAGTGEAELGKSLPSPLAEAGEMPALRSYVLSVRAGTEIRVRARAEAGSSEDANELAELVRGAFALGALGALTASSPDSVSFTPALESVEVETIDDRVEVSFEVDGRSVRDWLRKRAKAASPKSTAR